MTLFGKTIVGIIIILIGGTGYYFYSQPNAVPTVPTTTKEENVKPTGKKMAFSQLMTQNGTYKCTVTQYIENMESKGVVYMDKRLLRGEFSTIAGGQKIDTTMILRDGYTYTWTSMAPTMGFKVKAVTELNTSTSSTATGTYSWNADQIGDYNCEAWTPDETQFTLPAIIKFTLVN